MCKTLHDVCTSIIHDGRAEDGRQVSCVDISPFISNLPFGRPTQQFSSADASGSTSQAANIIESLEAGASLLLVDEDTSATNFMIRDARMQVCHPRWRVRLQQTACWGPFIFT